MARSNHIPLRRIMLGIVMRISIKSDQKVLERMYRKSMRIHSTKATRERPVDLPDARQPRCHVQPLPVPTAAGLGLGARQGAWTDQRHVAPQHVPELRQLVDARPAEESADVRDAGVVLQFEGRPVLFASCPQTRLPAAPRRATMVRNLYITKGRPPRPSRAWAKKTGPREVSFTARAANNNSGKIKINARPAPAMSTAPLPGGQGLEE